MNNGLDASVLAMASIMAARFRTRWEKQRRIEDPEYKAKMEAEELERAEALYTRQYNAALADNYEYKRAPRAFMRRLAKSTGGKS